MMTPIACPSCINSIVEPMFFMSGWHVRCDTCLCEGPVGNDRDHAILRWNHLFGKVERDNLSFVECCELMARCINKKLNTEANQIELDVLGFAMHLAWLKNRGGKPDQFEWVKDRLMVNVDSLPVYKEDYIPTIEPPPGTFEQS